MSLSALKKIFILIICMLSIVFSLIEFFFSSFDALIQRRIIKISNLSSRHVSFGCKWIEKICTFCGVKSCFKKSMIKKNFLMIFGKKPILNIGVSYTKSFKSHSWLELGNTNLYEYPDDEMKIINQIFYE